MKHSNARRRRPSLRVLLVAAVAIAAFAVVPIAAQAANHSNIDQCANDNDNNNARGPCGLPATGSLLGVWQNGDLNQNNSIYSEGDSVPFRIRYDGLQTGETVTMTLAYDDMKGGKHAYDFLTSWDSTESGDICGRTPNNVFCPPLDTSMQIPLDPQVTAATSPDAQTLVASRLFKCYGCTMVSVGTPTSGPGFPAAEETTIVVSFTVNADSQNGAAGGSPILAWGGHLARGLDWGAGLGASSITGGPFHMAMRTITCSVTDCSTGEQDRNIQPGAIQPVLAVKTHSFKAQRSGRAVTLRWQTASEENVLGYDVYRLVRGHRVKLNHRIIPAASLTKTATSHSYSFRAVLRSRKLAASSRYVLAEVHANGSRTMYGPVRASAAS